LARGSAFFIIFKLYQRDPAGLLKSDIQEGEIIQSEYNKMSDEEALAMGALSRGSGTTPTLLDLAMMSTSSC
jgi:hypothetical protein